MKAQSREPGSGFGGAALVTVLGGVVTLVGSLLAWIEINPPAGGRRFASRGGLTVQGTSLVPGKVALIAGIVLIVVGASMWMVRSGEARRMLSLLALVAGAVALGAVIAAFQNDGLGLAGHIGDRLPGLSEAGGRLGRALGRFKRLTQLSPSHGSGLYLALTGGIVAVAGAVASVFWTTVPVSAPPPAVTVTASEGPTESFSKGRAA